MSDLNIEFMGYEVPIIIHSYYAGCKAVMNPIERATPAEPEEVEFDVETNNELLNILLFENFYDSLEILVLEAIHQEQDNAAEEYAESKYEAERDSRYD